MAKVMDSVSTINSLLRTLLALVVVGGLGYGAWIAYDAVRYGGGRTQELLRAQQDLEETQFALTQVKQSLDERNRELEQRMAEIAELQEDVRQKAEQITKLDTSLRLLKVSHRVARLTVLDQVQDETDGQLYSIVQFSELSPEGVPLGQPKTFRIKGDVVYVDNWVVKFDDKYVEQSDIERSTSLVLFRRVFGEYQEPQQGYPLDEVGGRPLAYARGGEPSEFEKKIWQDFWTIANDEAKAAEMGIRAAHGEAPSIKVQKGKSYKILLRASDGLTITPDSSVSPPAAGPAT